MSDDHSPMTLESDPITRELKYLLNLRNLYLGGREAYPEIHRRYYEGHHNEHGGVDYALETAIREKLVSMVPGARRWEDLEAMAPELYHGAGVMLDGELIRLALRYQPRSETRAENLILDLLPAANTWEEAERVCPEVVEAYHRRPMPEVIELTRRVGEEQLAQLGAERDVA